MIKFGNSKKEDVEKLVRYENVVADMANIPVIDNNNCLPFKNNIQYIWTRFMQASKIIITSMTMFFTNHHLARIWEYLNNKNMDKIRALLQELLYDKVTW